MCPQPLLAPFSRAHTSVSIGREVSVIPLECELDGGRRGSQNESGFCHFSPHTVCPSHGALRVFLWKHQLPLSSQPLYALSPPPETPSPRAHPPWFPSTHSRWWCDATTPMIPPTCHSLFLSLSPPLNWEGRLMSEYLFCSQHLVFNLKKKLLNGEMNTWVNKKSSGFSISPAPPLGCVLGHACRAAKVSSPVADGAASTQRRPGAAWTRHKGGMGWVHRGHPRGCACGGQREDERWEGEGRSP